MIASEQKGNGARNSAWEDQVGRSTEVQGWRCLFYSLPFLRMLQLAVGNVSDVLFLLSYIRSKLPGSPRQE